MTVVQESGAAEHNVLIGVLEPVRIPGICNGLPVSALILGKIQQQFYLVIHIRSGNPDCIPDVIHICTKQIIIVCIIGTHHLSGTLSAEIRIRRIANPMSLQGLPCRRIDRIAPTSSVEVAADAISNRSVRL